jgi:type VI secretion system secreted protein VgrG
MANYTQQGRMLSVTTPLGTDVLLLMGFSGREQMSRLFSYQLEMASEKADIAPSDIVGQAVTWQMNLKDEEPRPFHGIVNRFVAGGPVVRGFRAYRAEVIPGPWFLTRTANCRIFQNKSAPEIVQTLFDESGFSDYQFALRRSYPKRKYCVQYRETAFNFISRLLEQEGIFYFFRHGTDKHTMVVADHAGVYTDCVSKPIRYTDGGTSPNLIATWEHQYEFPPGKYTQSDYNFETPSTNLLTSANSIVKLQGPEKYEIFDYPGEYEIRGDGESLTKLRMEEEEMPFERVMASGTCHAFTPGGKFTLDSPEVSAESGKTYVIGSIQHSAHDSTLWTSGGRSEYRNSFTCIPATIPYRPARVTRKPVVQGPQTAVVVGPKGEEIYTDKYGRVKVQFFWDRLGKKDENSSCWVRVAEAWGGKNWGVIFNPRIGQEVVVEFLDGDPDRPLITGRVYNAEQMPPYTLPANQTQSGIKTRSTKEGGTDNFNELRFEDKKSSEDIYFHAEKDFHRVVENDDDLKVGHDQTIEVKNDRTETVKEGNETITIKKGNRQVTIEMGNETLQIKMGNQSTKLDMGKSETEAMQSIELKVGQSSIKVDQMGVTIKGMMIQIEGQVQTQVKGLMTQVNGDAMLKMQGGITMIN